MKRSLVLIARCRSFLSRACSLQSISGCQYLRQAGLRIRIRLSEIRLWLRLSEIRLRLLLPTRLLRLPCAAAVLETLEAPCLEAGLVLAPKWCAFRTRRGALR